jgi:hypothetical protein
MAQPTPTHQSRPTAPSEQLIDEMVEQSFPASDPPQITGRTTDAAQATNAKAPPPERGTVASEAARGVPPTIGNQGEAPASNIVEETVNVSDLGAVTLRFDGDFRNLHVYLGEEGMALDAKALDKLIAALSQKRSQMQE